MLHKAKFHSKATITPTVTEPNEDDDKLYYSLISGEIDPKLIVRVESKEQKLIKKLNVEGIKTKFVFTNTARRLCQTGFVLDVLGF